ncbi:MAG: hypothetical protein OXH63_21890 [Gemmatimonadetes bacterium]|nr:hypothetical protein [Gemmatimonadota bacterium]
MIFRTAFVFALFVLAACSDQRSINAPESTAAAKALALPTASIEPDPSTIPFAADSTAWHTFTVYTTADSVLVVVNLAGTDSVLAVAVGPTPPEKSHCPAPPESHPARSHQDGELLHVSACGQGITQIVVKEHCYDLVLARYVVRVAADTSATSPPEEDDAGSLIDLFGGGEVVGVPDDTVLDVVETEPETKPEEEASEEKPAEETKEETEPADDQTGDGAADSDRAVLVVLYETTGGIIWDQSYNWRTSTPLSEWYGITTDAGGRVTKIELSNNLLVGPLPPKLGRLEKLAVLDLSDNLLIETIPPELGDLKNLKTLDFNSNLLEGPLPPELGRLENLEVLDLEWNLLSGPIPAELGRLKNLQRIRLSGFGRFSGCIPASLKGVPDHDFYWWNLPFCDGGSAKVIASDLGIKRPSMQDKEALRKRQAKAQYYLKALKHR